MKRIFLLIAMGVVVGLPAQGHATLIDRGTDNGYHLIYDSDLNITWYDYTNPADTWHNQNDWAADLSIDFNGTTYSDWRLPATFSEDCRPYGCTNSEMGHLYYTELENLSEGSLANTIPLQNLQAGFYWSGTPNYLYGIDGYNAWLFAFRDGAQGTRSVLDPFFALAVRPGDVVRAPVPEPATMLLLAAGLAGLGVWRKRIGRRRR